MEDLAPLPHAEKMLIIISNRLLIRKKYLRPDTDLHSELGLTLETKRDLITAIAERFNISIHNKLLNIIVAGKYIKDTFEGHLEKRIKTVYDIQKFIEGNDDNNNKPAAYNLR